MNFRFCARSMAQRWLGQVLRQQMGIVHWQGPKSLATNVRVRSAQGSSVGLQLAHAAQQGKGAIGQQADAQAVVDHAAHGVHACHLDALAQPSA